MRSWMRVVTTVGVVSLIVAGCSGGDGEETTTTLLDPVTTLDAATGEVDATSDGVGTATTSTIEGLDVTTTTTGAQGLPGYEIAFRADGEPGATVVVLLDPATYTALSDLDLQDVIRDVYDLFPPVSIAHVVDDADAVELVLLDRALTEEELALLDDHYFARLEDGIRIVYVGPFEAFPIAILGS